MPDRDTTAIVNQKAKDAAEFKAAMKQCARSRFYEYFFDSKKNSEKLSLKDYCRTHCPASLEHKLETLDNVRFFQKLYAYSNRYASRYILSMAISQHLAELQKWNFRFLTDQVRKQKIMVLTIALRVLSGSDPACLVEAIASNQQYRTGLFSHTGQLVREVFLCEEHRINIMVAQVAKDDAVVGQVVRDNTVACKS